MAFLQIVPILDTYFRRFEKPPKVRLNKQVVHFNYAHLSPFKGGHYLYFQDDSSIYIWYVANPLTTSTLVYIPEGYLIYRFFRHRGNALVLRNDANKTTVLAIKDGQLEAQITTGSTHGHHDVIDRICREYSLKTPEVIQLDLTASFPVKLFDIVSFTHLEFKPSQFFEDALNLLKIPITAILLISSLFIFYQEHLLQAELENSTRQLRNLKHQNQELLAPIDQLRDSNASWADFINKKMVYYSFYRYLSELSNVVDKNSGFINSVDFTDNHFTVWTGVKASETVIIKSLIDTGLFQDVKLISSTKDGSKPEYILYNLELTLKPLRGGKSK